MALIATLWQQSSRVCSVHLMLLFELAHTSMTTPRHSNLQHSIQGEVSNKIAERKKKKKKTTSEFTWYSKFCILLSLTRFVHLMCSHSGQQLWLKGWELGQQPQGHSLDPTDQNCRTHILLIASCFCAVTHLPFTFKSSWSQLLLSL